MKKKILGYYNYTVVLTYCGMLFAFAGILQVLEQQFGYAVFCLMASGLCDMFDGAVAATKKRDVSEKRFGIQIDSLSDLISFGVLPALIVYEFSERKIVIGILAGIYVLCALIRLAYFNVLEEQRQDQTSEARIYYLGLPVTTIALAMPAAYILLANDLLFKNQTVKEWCLPVLLAIVAIGFVSAFKLKKPKLKGKLCLLLLGVVEAVSMIVMIMQGMKL